MNPLTMRLSCLAFSNEYAGIRVPGFQLCSEPGKDAVGVSDDSDIAGGVA